MKKGKIPAVGEETRVSFAHKLVAEDGVTKVSSIGLGATVLHKVTVRNEGHRTTQHYVFRATPDSGLSYGPDDHVAWVVRGRHLQVDPDYLTDADSPAVDELTGTLYHTDDTHAGRHVIDVEFSFAPEDQAAFPTPQIHRKTLTCK